MNASCHQPLIFPALVLEVTPLFSSHEKVRGNALSGDDSSLSISSLRNHLIKKQARRHANGESMHPSGAHKIKWNSSSVPSVPHSSESRALRSGYLVDDSRRKHVLSSRGQRSCADSPFPVFYLPSNNPVVCPRQPCKVEAFVMTGYPRRDEKAMVTVTTSTLIYILAPQVMHSPRQSLFDSGFTHTASTAVYNSLLVEESPRLSGAVCADIFQSHSTDTIQEIKHRMASQLSRLVHVGTTRRSVPTSRKSRRRFKTLRCSVHWYCRQIGVRSSLDGWSPYRTLEEKTRNEKKYVLVGQPLLLVHSQSNEEETMPTIQTIAKKIGCSRFSVIQPADVLVRSKTFADSTLECMLHSMVIRSAIRKEILCIVLDNFHAMMPSHFVARSASGDAAAPILSSTGRLYQLSSSSILVQLSIDSPLL